MRTVLHAIGSLAGGGAERQLALLAIAQVRSGYDVHIALRRGGVFLDRVQAAGVTIHWLDDRKHVPLRRVAQLVALIRKTRPDVVQSWLPELDVIAGTAALATRTPWILNERSTQQLYAPSLFLALRRRIGRYASAVVANSQAGADYWRAIASSVSVIANAVDIAAIDAAARADAAVATVLCVGRLSPEKAPEIFVRAMALLPRDHDVVGLVIGDGPLRPALAQLIETLGISERVRLQPFRDDWWGLLKVARAVVSPSRIEGLPNVLLEAMAAGCPVIATDIAAHRALLDASSALLVPVDNPQAVADAIATTLRDPDAARERTRHAAARASTCTVERMASDYERIYRGVTA